MNPPENEVVTFAKEWVWPAVVGVGTIAAGAAKWLWQRNEKEHDELRQQAKQKHDELLYAIEKQRKDYERLKESASQGHSQLNDRLMEHVDTRVDEAIKFAREEDGRLMAELAMHRGHIAKLFDKLEDHARRSEDRHLELLQAIHVGLAGKADK